jgi:hypothetical protein
MLPKDTYRVLIAAALLSSCGGGGGSNTPADRSASGVTSAEPGAGGSVAAVPALPPGQSAPANAGTGTGTAPSAGPAAPDPLAVYIDTKKIPAPASGFASVRVQPDSASTSLNSDGTGQFRMTCSFSHMNFDDPIVAPGKPGGSHLHVFFGNTGIDAMSTQSSIENSGNSTCAGGIANRTGYWVPAVVDTRDGAPQTPIDILVYYKSDPLPGSRTQPFPRGLRMIAGDPKATGATSAIDWGCLKADGSERRGAAIPAICAVGDTVEMTVNFPPCWDGVNLDAPDHKSHMAYPVGDPSSPTRMGCPPSHPVQLPVITEKVRYRVLEAGSTARWRLSSDRYDTSLPGGYSAHGDWFNGWDVATERAWVDNCLKAGRDCHGYLLGDGRTLF